MSFGRITISGFIIVMFFTSNPIKADSLDVPVSTTSCAKFYVDADGRFYAAEAQKLYFHISASPDPRDGYYTLQPLSGEDSVGGVQLEAGEYIIKKPHLGTTPASKPSLINPEDFRIIIDGTPPVDKIEFSEAKSFIHRDTTYYGPSLQLTLSASDDLSGVAAIVFQRNGGDWLTYNAPLAGFAKDEWNVISYYSLDNVGNRNEQKNVLFYTDVNPPITQILFGGEHVGNIHHDASKIGLVSIDNLSGCNQTYYYIDHKKTTVYKSPIELLALENGPHTLIYWADDNVFNEEQHQEYRFIVDKKPPEVSIFYKGDNYCMEGITFITPHTKLELSAVDDYAGVAQVLCTIDNDSFSLYNPPISIVESGLHDFSSYAVDSVGNRSEILTARCFLDQSPPVSRHKLSGSYFQDKDVYLINSRTEIEISSADLESGVQNTFYTLNESEARLYETAIRILEDGFYHLAYYSSDQLNNVEERKIITLQVDNSPKRVTIQPKRAGDERRWKGNPDGTVMGPANLDFFLRIAASPEDTAQSWLIDLSRLTTASGSQADSIIPLLFLDEGINLISMGWSGTPRQQFKIPIDTQPPISQIVYQNANRFSREGITYFSGGLTLQFNAEDTKKGICSGLWKIYYSIDGSDYVLFTQPLCSFVREKQYQIGFYAVDSVGNEEGTKEIQFTIDLSAPESQHRIGGSFSGQNLSPSSVISLSATDNLSGVQNIYYRFDDNPEHSYYGELQESILNALPEGTHQLYYYSLDNVGNREEIKCFNFNFSKKAPDITLVLQGDKFFSNSQWYISSRTRMVLSSPEQIRFIKQIQYKLDDSEFSIFKTPLLAPERSGAHHLYYRCLDIHGNTGSTQKVALFLDKIPPVTKINFEGIQYKSDNLLFLNPQTKILLFASDQESGVKVVQYRISGGQIKTYTTPITISTEGKHLIQFRSLDQVNNQEEWVSTSVIVDGTPPAIELSFREPPKSEKGGYLIAPNNLIYINATDALTKIDLLTYSLNGEKDIIYRFPLTNFTSDTRMTLVISAVDIMKNRSQKTIELQVQ